MTLTRRIVLAAVAGAAVAGLAAPPAAAASPPLVDADNRPIDAADSARLVTVGGALTEIVYRLGVEKRLVAVDTTSQFPPDALKRLPNVGYMRALSAEGILALKPTLVVVDADAGPPSALVQIKAAGTRLVVLKRDASPEGVVYKIRALAKLLGEDEKGAALADAFNADMAALSLAVAQAKSKPRVLFILGVARGAPMVSGTGTAADAMIALAGGVNAIRGYEGYKPLSPEAAVAARPDVILTTSHGVGSAGGEEKLLARPDLAQTEAGRNRRLVAMESLLLLGMGPRTPEALHQLAAHLHPGLALPSLKSRSDAQ